MRGALAFLTPLGGAAAPGPRAVRWFPAVGALVGVVVGLVWRGSVELWPVAVAAGLAVAADLALTGMLHVDGLADSADGLLPHLDRDRRLTVMREPTVGAFGVVVVALVLLLRWSALVSMAPDVWLVAGLWCLSRTLMAVVLTSVPYVGGGLASAFRGAPARPALAAGALGAAVLVVVAVGVPGAAVVAAAALAGGGVVWLGVHRVGGFTGDVLGAAGVVCETVGLLVAAARW